jgi:hypothetical protein
VGIAVGPPTPSNPSRVLKTPASDLSRRYEALRSLLGGELEARSRGHPVEGLSLSFCHNSAIDFVLTEPHALPPDVSTWLNVTVAPRVPGTSCR